MKTMNTKEVLAYLHVSSMTLYRLREDGLPYFKIGGKVLYSQERIDEWLKEREVSDDKKD